ncbi:MAG: glycoside hydrolase domain-containing protein [Terriglobales bacterium]
MSRFTFHLALLVGLAITAAPQSSHTPATYLGFDRNQYPGDDSLAALRETFRFAGFWLNNPPGENSNTWRGKRSLLKSRGFGFLVLFNGRVYKQLKAPADAAALGQADARSAVAAAKEEGFPAGTVIFIDQEEGGRMLAEQRAYLHAWVDGLKRAGYRAGVYCSGMPFKESSRETVITAEDIRQHAGGREIVYWVANDACPPSPGCALPAAPAGRSGVSFAAVWQFAQSPRRAQFVSGCANYAADGNCYAPGTQVFVDLDAADSPDPSRGR